ncbi:hypothetical protein ABG067_002708 [Albugo candida]|uniref:Complex 1 LYR protein domain-containing protein n=1 Tax=Albugo candida TaxID=65357 RepID=A0A024GD22_9STRA|nr:unnamed protein product [Albugo candida]|eukprot:CCI44232.1 unnamed protein product [Albugo candida]
MERAQIFGLYRRILRLARRYPSIKRDAIVEDIRLEFRESRNIARPAAIEQKIASANAGIKELMMYANLNPVEANWTVEIGRPSEKAADIDQKRVEMKEKRVGVEK